MFFVAGVPMLWVTVLAALGVGGIAAAYTALPHVTARVDKFLAKINGTEGPRGASESFQADRAIDSFTNGGWLGRGPGEGTVKWILPDSHTDFIFAVVGEEFGILACMVLVGLFAFIILRGLRHALIAEDPFLRLAITGLVALFGVPDGHQPRRQPASDPVEGHDAALHLVGRVVHAGARLRDELPPRVDRRRPQANRIARSIHDEGPMEAMA